MLSRNEYMMDAESLYSSSLSLSRADMAKSKASRAIYDAINNGKQGGEGYLKSIGGIVPLFVEEDAEVEGHVQSARVGNLQARLRQVVPLRITTVAALDGLLPALVLHEEVKRLCQ